MNTLKFIIIYLVISPVWAFEPIENENSQWFLRCEMGQKGFDVGMLYKDHIRYYKPERYDEQVNDKYGKDKFIKETKTRLEMVSICHPNIELSFFVTLPSYNENNREFKLEKIQSHQKIIIKNTIYSALPAEFHIVIPEILLPETINMSKFEMSSFSETCVGIHLDKSSRAILELSVMIQRVSSGNYIAKAKSGRIKTFCPKLRNKYKELVSFRYQEG